MCVCLSVHLPVCLSNRSFHIVEEPKPSIRTGASGMDSDVTVDSFLGDVIIRWIDRAVVHVEDEGPPVVEELMTNAVALVGVEIDVDDAVLLA